MLDVGLSISIVAVGLAGFGYFKSHFKAKDIADILTRLVALETKIEPFWAIVEKQMATVLHSPHTPELDALLEKITHDQTLEVAERARLVELLEEAIHDDSAGNGYKVGAALMLAALAHSIPELSDKLPKVATKDKSCPPQP